MRPYILWIAFIFISNPVFLFAHDQYQYSTDSGTDLNDSAEVETSYKKIGVANKSENKHSSASLFIQFGRNYSEYLTTHSYGKLEPSFGIYINVPANRKFSFKAGWLYTEKQVELRNKILLGDSQDILTHAGKIQTVHRIVEINFLLEYSLFSYKKLEFSSFVGGGWGMYINEDTKFIDTSQEDVSGSGYNSNCDYRYGDELPPVWYTNAGLVKHLGMRVGIGRFSLSLVYTLHPSSIELISRYLYFNEKLHSVSLLAGLSI